MNTMLDSEAQPRGEPELVVITSSEAEVRVEGDSVTSMSGAPVSEIGDILASEGGRMESLFGGRPEEMASAMPAEAAGGQFGSFFRVHAPEERLESLAEQLRALDTVDAAYVKPPGEPPQVTLERPSGVAQAERAVQEAPAATPDFTARQHYLGPAPVGIDAAYAWELPGGRGQSIRVIDCEWGWQFTHEDLPHNSLGLIGGSNHTSTDHGTAVFGEIGGDRNAFGVTGIADEARLGASSFVGPE